MTAKKLIGMAVVLAVLAGVAVLQRRGGESRRDRDAAIETKLLAGVDLNAVDRINVAEESDSVTVAKTDGRWTVETLYGYPADFSKLAGALRAAADVDLGRPVRSENVDAAEFGLEDGVKTIELQSAGEPVAEVYVGDRREASSGWANEFFIRKGDSDAVYLVAYDFRPFSATPADWIDKQLVRVPSADIVAVEAGDVKLTEESGSWKLADLNAETEEFQSSEANRLRSALQYFSCTTVADPSKTDAELGFDSAKEYSAETKDGLIYNVKVGGEADDGRYVRLSVEYVRPEPPSKPEGDDEEKQAAYEQELKTFNETADANESKAENLNEKLAGWTYVISSYTAESLMISRDQLVKEKEAEDESESAEG